MRLEAEVRPDGTVLGGLRRPPISRLPPLDRHGSLLRAPPTPLGLTSVEDHSDSLIGPKALAQLPTEFRPIAADHDEPSAQALPDCPCALMTLPSAGRGPGGGTRMALMNPSSITFLAIVVVASGRRHDGLLLDRGFRETLPKHVPVPWEATEPQTSQTDRPATPEWVVHEDSPRLVQGGSGPSGSLSSHPFRVSRASSSGRAPSWTLRLARRVPLVEDLKGRGLSCSFPNIQHDVVPPVFSGYGL